MHAYQWIQGTIEQIESATTFTCGMDADMMLVVDALFVELFEAVALEVGGHTC